MEKTWKQLPNTRLVVSSEGEFACISPIYNEKKSRVLIKAYGEKSTLTRYKAEVVAELFVLERPLNSSESISFKDGNPINLKANNLEIVKKSFDAQGKKRIRCVEDDKIFESIAEAAKYYGKASAGISLNARGLSSECRTKDGRKIHFRYLDYEFPVKISKRNKRVLNLTTGKEYESLAVAAKEYGVSKQALSQACKGRVKTACKCKWKFADEPKSKD